jgi:hypothetical protein
MNKLFAKFLGLILTANLGTAGGQEPILLQPVDEQTPLAIVEQYQPTVQNIQPVKATPVNNAGLERLQERQIEPQQVQITEAQYSAALGRLNIHQPDGSTHREESNPTHAEETKCRANVYRTLMALPGDHTQYLKELTLFYTNDGRRGWGSRSTITLRCRNVTDSELAGVMTHEMGHIVDLGKLNGTVFGGTTEFHDFGDAIFQDDPSVSFYRISWSDTEKMHENSTALDFVSGYAMSDPFEDFSETYAFYTLQGPTFRAFASNNVQLQKKYEYMRNTIFHGQEFGSGIAQLSDIMQVFRNYDTTVLKYDLEAFWTRGDTRIAQTFLP